MIDKYKELSSDIIFNILEYIDDCTTKMVNGRIIIYEPKYKIILSKLKYFCSITDHCNVKSWRNFNHICMKILYKNCSHKDFHLLLRDMGLIHFIQFIELETVNMMHYLSLQYYQVLKYIYDTKYPILTNDNRKIIYSIFWDYCKFYFLVYKNLIPKEHIYLL